MINLSIDKIQLRDTDRVFRLYIKSLGDKAVYMVEESLKMRCPIVDVLRTIRSPRELQDKKLSLRYPTETFHL